MAHIQQFMALEGVELSRLSLENKTGLRRGLVTYFNDEEIRTLCVDLGVDYENLAGATKESKARELIDYLERLQRIQDLVLECSRQRPNADWYRYVQASAATNPVGEEKAVNVKAQQISRPKEAEHSSSFHLPREKIPLWVILPAPPVSWLIGHFISLALVRASSTPFVILGTVGGIVCVMFVTSISITITNARRIVRRSQVIRISAGFLIAGLLSGFVGLFLWLIGCAFDTNSMFQQSVGCYDTSSIVWRLVAGISSLVGLVGASAYMLIEFGVTRLRRP